MNKLKKFYTDHREACDVGIVVGAVTVSTVMWYYTGKSRGYNKGYIRCANDRQILGASPITHADGRSGIYIKLANGMTVSLFERKTESTAE